MHQHATADFARAVTADRVGAATAMRHRTRLAAADFERLLPAAAAGDEQAWEALFAHFQPILVRAAQRRGLTRPQAEDAVQETWIRLLNNAERVRNPRALGGWLAKTALHESLRVRESAARELPSSHDPLDGVADPTDVEAEARIERAALEEALARALSGLPVRHRGLMRMLFAESAPSYLEISAKLEIPIGSIGPIRGRCLSRLRSIEPLHELAA